MQNENALTKELRNMLLAEGADLVGIGDLTKLPANVRCGLPTGVGVAVKFPKDIIRGISELPTQEYRDWYGLLNDRLDALVTLGAKLLEEKGYQAVAKTRAQVGDYSKSCQTELPHKTVATRAGMGWIGKCALLVTEKYGSMVRISSILTDAPLTAAEPIDRSRCGDCAICQEACPAGAVHGALWDISKVRDDLFDYQECRKTAHARSERGYGKSEGLCGKCIEVCPYTRRYLNREES